VCASESTSYPAAQPLQGKVTSPPLVYEGQQESYYFQAEPPGQFGMERDLDRPPVSCLLSPIYPGQSMQTPLHPRAIALSLTDPR